MMNIADELIRTRQRSFKSDDEYRNALFELQTVELNFTPYQKLTFNYPQVSNKVKFVKRQIDNALASELNNLIASVESNKSQNIILYKLLKIKRALKPALQNIQALIDDSMYDLEALGRKKERYSLDRVFYEDTYIWNYLQQSLIWFALEFQSHYIDQIPEEKQITNETIYVEYLQMAVPESLFVTPISMVENRTKDMDKKPELDMNVDIEKMPSNAQLFFNEVQKYNFTSLPKLSSIDGNKQSLIITKIVSHDTPYSIAMLDFLGYPKYLKESYSLNKEQIYKHVAGALGISQRQVKGNFLVLKEGSSEDTSRYTSYQFKTDVKADYEAVTG